MGDRGSSATRSVGRDGGGCRLSVGRARGARSGRHARRCPSLSVSGQPPESDRRGAADLGSILVELLARLPKAASAAWILDIRPLPAEGPRRDRRRPEDDRDAARLAAQPAVSHVRAAQCPDEPRRSRPLVQRDGSSGGLVRDRGGHPIVAVRCDGSRRDPARVWLAHQDHNRWPIRADHGRHSSARRPVGSGRGRPRVATRGCRSQPAPGGAVRRSRSGPPADRG